MKSPKLARSDDVNHVTRCYKFRLNINPLDQSIIAISPLSSAAPKSRTEFALAAHPGLPFARTLRSCLNFLLYALVSIFSLSSQCPKPEHT
jgi:hypothetical protein